MTWSAEKRAGRISWGSAELSSAIGILVIRVFSRGIQVCKKINTFLWVCQVFVLFFFVLWRLKHIVSASRFAVAGMFKLFAAHVAPQDICRATLSAIGHFIELLEALFMVNKLLELNGQCIITRLEHVIGPAVGFEPFNEGRAVISIKRNY